MPPYARAVIHALSLSLSRFDELDALSEKEWERLLRFADRTQLTLPLALNCRESVPAHVPESVRQRLESNLARNAERWPRVKAAYLEAAAAFEAAGLHCAVLKGFSHCPEFVSDPRFRAQFDLDLLFPRDQVARAQTVAAQLGYEPLAGFERFPIDHLPTLVRKTGWEWRGDYFDPEIPLSIELHFRLWDNATEGFAPQGLDEFWKRRGTRQVEDLQFTALNPVDALGYAALHMMRHLLRGDLRPSHVYEIAWFLDRHTHADFWSAWGNLHSESLRRLEAICFAIAEKWFGCRLAVQAREEMNRLPHPVQRWLEMFAYAPLSGLFHPNKDELWLHLSLAASVRARAAIVLRRLLPIQLPGPVDAVHTPDAQRTLSVRLRSGRRYAWFIASRIVHHIRALFSAARSGLKWAGWGRR